MTVTNVTVPVISGTAQQGKTLYTSNGTWTYDLDILTYAYRWLRCDTAGANCVPIAGATSSGLLLTSADVGSKIRSEVTATEQVGTPLPPESGPVTITTGGTYLVNAVSPDTTPAVTVNTTQPVTVTGAVKNEHGGTLVNCTSNVAVQVTLDHLTATGGSTYQTSGRFLVAEGFKSVTVQNCTIENTRGMEIDEPSLTGSSVLITRNIHHNIKGYSPGGTIVALGNFVQFRTLSRASIEISWNQIINDYNDSMPEDVISCYQTSHMHMHDNYIQGLYSIGNVSSSQGGITVESAAVPGSTFDENVHDNQLVNMQGGIFFAGDTHDSYCNGNRIVCCGLLWGTSTPFGNGFEAVYIGGSNNHADANVIGYIGSQGRQDGRFPGIVGSDNTTHLANPITHSTELDEWTFWQNKLASNGITIGA